jgi:hypothetical protein
VLEQIGRVGWTSAAEDQLGLDQPAHGLDKLGLGQSSESCDGTVVEAAADDGGGLCHLLHYGL